MEVFYSNHIADGKIYLSPEESAHCIKVLRHKVGDEIRVSGGDGNLYRCSIEVAAAKCVELSILSIEGGFGKHPYYLHIAVAPTKNIDRYEWFLEKGTEVGIDAITPILCSHSERKVIKEERQERVIIAAAKQSLKGEIPVAAPLTPVKEFIDSVADFKGGKYIAYCDSELINAEGNAIPRIPLTLALREQSAKDGELRSIVLIGPEGDFSLEEIRYAATAGFHPISLGDSRLRTETAALTATLAHYLESLSQIL